MAWYTRWLREVAHGYHIFWFGTNLDGTEEELRQYYTEASNEADKRLALSSMEKFPSLSTESAAWFEQIALDFVLEPDARWLLKLLHRIAPEKKDSFMEKRWEAGMYDGIITEILLL